MTTLGDCLANDEDKDRFTYHNQSIKYNKDTNKLEYKFIPTKPSEMES